MHIYKLFQLWYWDISWHYPYKKHKIIWCTDMQPREILLIISVYFSLLNTILMLMLYKIRLFFKCMIAYGCHPLLFLMGGHLHLQNLRNLISLFSCGYYRRVFIVWILPIIKNDKRQGTFFSQTDYMSDFYSRR